MILCPTIPIATRPRAALSTCPSGGADDSTRESPNLAQLAPIEAGGLRSNIRDTLVVLNVCGHERDAGHDLTLRIGSVIVEAIGVVTVLVQLS